MQLFSRLVEIVETAWRLIPVKGSRIAALERFYAAHRRGCVAVDENGVLKAAFPPARPVLVSVVILTLNGGEMLRTLFASLKAHNTWPSLEFIVVDHGGDPLTAEVLAVASRDFVIRHLRPGRNFSFAFSCNRGAQAANGDIVLFLNNDIELTEDLVPSMVAAVQATDGLVGIKLWHKHEAGHIAPEPQIGVRFRWNLHQGWTVPYETAPGHRDGLRLVRPSFMPIVTAAVLACSRERFLSLGGFGEEYLYAYEDVDFGLKAAAQQGMRSLSLNSISALHLVGATRFKRAHRERRRVWHRYNLKVFRRRCGYRNRRLAWLGLFGAGGFDWGRKPAVALLASPRDADARAAASSLGEQFGDFAEIRRDSFRGRDLYGYDLVVSRLPSFCFRRVRNLSPMAIRVAWTQGEAGWADSADAYDLLVANTNGDADKLSSATGRPVHVLDVHRTADSLSGIVTDFLRDRFRLVLMTPDIRDIRALRLAAAFRARGDAVRIEKIGRRLPAETMRQDIAIWLAPPVATGLPEDVCHVAAFRQQGATDGFGDIRIGPWEMDFDGWFDLLAAEIGGYHGKQMLGPVDAPLDDLELSDDEDAPSLWRWRADPTEWLIRRP